MNLIRIIHNIKYDIQKGCYSDMTRISPKPNSQLTPFSALGEAPFSIKNLTSLACPPSAARWSGVESPTRFLPLMTTPRLWRISSRNTSTEPLRAAMWAHVFPSCGWVGRGGGKGGRVVFGFILVRISCRNISSENGIVIMNIIIHISVFIKPAFLFLTVDSIHIYAYTRSSHRSHIKQNCTRK